MNCVKKPGVLGARPRVSPRLVAADWARLSDEARDQALAIARYEGRRAARWYLAETTDGMDAAGSLRDCRWAREHENLDQLPDDTFHLYTIYHTFPCEVDYFTFIVEPYCPERISWWWRIPPADRREDPRVCAFCDAYERERCRILGLKEPPTGITDLKRYLWKAKEHERESGRIWLARVEELSLDIEEQESRWSGVRWEFQRSVLATDLAQMLLDAAIYHAQVRH